MHKAICTKVQGKTYFKTKLNNVDQIFRFSTFYEFFFFFWIFLTHKKEKIDLKQPCKNIRCKNKQTNSLQLKQPTSTQPNIGSINAWTCCNAYA